MEQLLLTLSDLDHQIKAILAIEEINTEEINHLVDKRERILQNLLMYASENPRFANSAQFMGSSALSKNIEDKTSTINHSALAQMF